jgi:hypothetical protein
MEMGSSQGISITRIDVLKCRLRKLGFTLGNIMKRSYTGKIVSSGAKVQNKRYTTG